MEKVGQRFFFIRANKEIDTVFREIGRVFPDIFGNSSKNRINRTEFSGIADVREGVEQRERLKLSVMRFLPANYDLKLLTLYDFFFFANEARKLPPPKPNHMNAR
jgi:hypothetical protein